VWLLMLLCVKVCVVFFISVLVMFMVLIGYMVLLVFSRMMELML